MARKKHLIALDVQWSVKRVIKSGNHKTLSLCVCVSVKAAWVAAQKKVLNFIIFYHFTLSQQLADEHGGDDDSENH